MRSLLKTAIFRRLFISFAALSFLSLGGFGVGVLSKTKSAIESRQFEVSRIYTHEVADHLRSWIDERRLDVQVLSAAIGPGAASRDDLSRRLQAFLALSEDFVDAFFLDGEGYVLASKIVGSAKRTYLGDRDYVRSALRGEPFISAYFLGRNKATPIFAIAYPTKGTLGRDGAAAGIFSLARIVKIVDENSLDRIGRAFLVDREGRLVSNPSFIESYARGEGGDTFRLETVAAKELRNGRSGSARYRDAEGREVFGSYEWIPEIGLGLVVELSAASALRPVTDLIAFGLTLIVAIFVILLFFAYGLAARFLAPIAALVDAADKLESGAFVGPILLKTGTELDQLTEFFNRMALSVCRREQSLREDAARDSLTGLYNHARLVEYLELELRGKRRAGDSIAFVMIDIDHFKEVNDRYGHPAGDEVLVSLSRILESKARSGDLVGRYGGEEFGVILEGASPAIAAAFCERIRVLVESRCFETVGGPVTMTVSLGWTCAGEDKSAAEMIAEADKALYEAKRSGRNRVCGYSRLAAQPGADYSGAARPAGPPAPPPADPGADPAAPRAKEGEA
ncbi:MAG: diguanylate cyclase [Spirochaetaceae bacterium]|nr:diguanylate cyclase [Spirochaetaceae bacterium]